MKPGSKYYYLIHNVKTLPRGQANLALKGKEFTCEPESFRSVVYDLAATKGRGWIASTMVIGDAVLYVFYVRTDLMRPNLPAFPIVRKLRGEKE